jgi:hypothetical protein
MIAKLRRDLAQSAPSTRTPTTPAQYRTRLQRCPPDASVLAPWHLRNRRRTHHGRRFRTESSSKGLVHVLVRAECGKFWGDKIRTAYQQAHDQTAGYLSAQVECSDCARLAAEHGSHRFSARRLRAIRRGCHTELREQEDSHQRSYAEAAVVWACMAAGMTRKFCYQKHIGQSPPQVRGR